MSAIFDHLLQNDGFFLRREAVALGVSDRHLRDAVAAGILLRFRHGAYGEAAYVAGLDAVGNHVLRCRAVVRASRTSVVLSHLSSLAVHGAPLWDLDLSHVHVVRPGGHAGRREAGVVPHGEHLRDGDVVVRRGLRLTSPARAGVELSTATDVEHALPVLDWLLHTRRTTKQELRAHAAELRHHPGSLATDLAITLAQPRAESVGESRTLYLCWRHGLPRPEVNHEIRDSRGRVVARVDLAWPEHGVFLEFDGAEKYTRWLRPGETSDSVVVREKRREEMIRRLTGWRCLRLTWADLQRPEATATWIRSVLAGAPIYDNPLCPR